MPLPALVPVTPENADLHLFVGGSHMLQSAKFEWKWYIGTVKHYCDGYSTLSFQYSQT